MAAIAPSFLTDPWTPAELADLDLDIEREREDVLRLRGVLARRNVTGSYARKIEWQLAAAERGLARYQRLRADVAGRAG